MRIAACRSLRTLPGLFERNRTGLAEKLGGPALPAGREGAFMEKGGKRLDTAFWQCYNSAKAIQMDTFPNR